MIMKGTCHVLIRGKSRPVRTLKAGDYFGEISLVTRVARSATIRAQSFCNFAVIYRRKIMMLLRLITRMSLRRLNE